MIREQGIEIVNKYTNNKPLNLELFLKWIGITENSFHYLIDQHRSKQIWKRNDDWAWKINQNIENDKIIEASISRLKSTDVFASFLLTKTKKVVIQKINTY
jgi:hypothetical protein